MSISSAVGERASHRHDLGLQNAEWLDNFDLNTYTARKASKALPSCAARRY